jgi:hypothetical protein
MVSFIRTSPWNLCSWSLAYVSFHVLRLLLSIQAFLCLFSEQVAENSRFWITIAGKGFCPFDCFRCMGFSSPVALKPVRVMCESCFQDCFELTKVTFESFATIHMISSWGFRSCFTLQSFTAPSPVSTLFFFLRGKFQIVTCGIDDHITSHE